MKRIKSAIVTALSFAMAFSALSIKVFASELPDYTDKEKVGVLVDLTDGEYLDNDEINELQEILEDTAEAVGFSVGVIVTDDIPNATSGGGYQEYAVEAYTESSYQEMFGDLDNDDGILLVINYETNYDCMTSGGLANSYINESRQQLMFDNITPILIDGNTSGAIEEFSNQVLRFYHKGTIRMANMKKGALIGLVVGAIIAVTVYFATKNSYSKYPQTAASNYLNSNNTKFVAKEDRFIRQYTTRVKHSSSSSGGRSGGGGGGGGHSTSGRGR